MHALVEDEPFGMISQHLVGLPCNVLGRAKGANVPKRNTSRGWLLETTFGDPPKDVSEGVTGGK